MVFSRWFQVQLNKAEILQRMDRRLKNLEKSVNELKTKKDQPPQYVAAVPPSDSDSDKTPIIIEYLNVEKIEVDRYEQSNNFGALGIKSLEGKLNIGANYGLADTLPEEKQKSFEEQLKKAGVLYKNQKQEQKNTKMPPKTTIRPRPGDHS